MHQVVRLAHTLFVFFIRVAIGTIACAPRLVLGVVARVGAGPLLFLLGAQALVGQLELGRCVLWVRHFLCYGMRTWFGLRLGTHRHGKG